MKLALTDRLAGSSPLTKLVMSASFCASAAASVSSVFSGANAATSRSNWAFSTGGRLSVGMAVDSVVTAWARDCRAAVASVSNVPTSPEVSAVMAAVS